MDTKWLYRAAGTVGLAGGFLLLGAGGAHADETESTEALLLDELLGDVFSPTAGLPPLDLAVDTDPVTDGLPLDQVSLDRVGLPGTLGGLPTSGLAKVDGQAVGLPTRLETPATDARTLPAPAERPTGQEEIVGPGLLQPISEGLLGGLSLGQVAPVGDLAGQVPVAGPMISQTTNGLPLVGDIVPTNDGRLPPSAHHMPAPGPVADQAAPADQVAPAGDDQLPAVIAQELASEGGYSPELFEDPELFDDRAEVIGGLPLLAPALEPLGKMVGVGNLPSQLPLVGPLAGNALGGLPVVTDPAPAAAAGPTVPGPAAPAAGPPAAAPAAAEAAAERPYAGEDAAYPSYRAIEESAEVLPTAGLTQQLPLDALSGPVTLLRGLPVVGSVPGLLPI